MLYWSPQPWAMPLTPVQVVTPWTATRWHPQKVTTRENRIGQWIYSTIYGWRLWLLPIVTIYVSAPRVLKIASYLHMDYKHIFVMISCNIINKDFLQKHKKWASNEQRICPHAPQYSVFFNKKHHSSLQRHVDISRVRSSNKIQSIG